MKTHNNTFLAFLGISLLAATCIVKNDKIKELESRLSKFPSEVAEMKIQEMDGNFFTTEYMARVRAGPNTDHTKWIYLKEFDPSARSQTYTLPATTNSVSLSPRETAETYNSASEQWEAENVEAGN